MMAFFQSFTLIRVIRLALGSYILADGIIQKDWLFGAIGILLLAQGVFNLGCASGTCAPTSQTLNNVDTSEEIVFEEVK